MDTLTNTLCQPTMPNFRLKDSHPPTHSSQALLLGLETALTLLETWALFNALTVVINNSQGSGFK